jgi:hypothetical protein
MPSTARRACRQKAYRQRQQLAARNADPVTALADPGEDTPPVGPDWWPGDPSSRFRVFRCSRDDDTGLWYYWVRENDLASVFQQQIEDFVLTLAAIGLPRTKKYKTLLAKDARLNAEPVPRTLPGDLDPDRAAYLADLLRPS